MASGNKICSSVIFPTKKNQFQQPKIAANELVIFEISVECRKPLLLEFQLQACTAKRADSVTEPTVGRADAITIVERMAWNTFGTSTLSIVMPLSFTVSTAAPRTHGSRLLRLPQGPYAPSVQPEHKSAKSVDNIPTLARNF